MTIEKLLKLKRPVTFQRVDRMKWIRRYIVQESQRIYQHRVQKECTNIDTYKYECCEKDRYLWKPVVEVVAAVRRIGRLRSGYEWARRAAFLRSECEVMLYRYWGMYVHVGNVCVLASVGSVACAHRRWIDAAWILRFVDEPRNADMQPRNYLQLTLAILKPHIVKSPFALQVRI